ncbi:RNA guanine-N7 methyltransferase activating subunit-like [Xenia sp. Carnegie-2017]|uniref:RNA guanine-N7 methyltransferase activating subunit-like n=1 Tax=Xenia sp. Carnegie-2017 TaxID=2897299 RepID=UPI001F04B2B0|nr:RNA guanine-N7 methyltransferase activating subunit-like [Xenia sp. Carnegie-2017]
MSTLEQRLAEYETLFANRYTENDKCYQMHVNTPVMSPPVIADWNNNRRQDNRGRDGGRGWDTRYDRRDNSRDNHGGGNQDYRDRGHRDSRHVEYKTSNYYEMYY